MSFFETGNPVPSDDPRDLDDNAKHLDIAVNTLEETWVDRNGTTRKSLRGLEHGLQEMDDAFEAAQAERAEDFNEFLANTMYEVPVEYVPGLEITRATKTVIVSGIVYRPIVEELPFETTTFGADAAKWAVLGDASLRQDLAGDSGSLAVGFIQAGTGAVHRTTQEKQRETWVSIKDFGAKGDYVIGVGGTDDTDRIRDCIAFCIANQRTMFVPSLPPGRVYFITGTLRTKGISIVGEDAFASQFYCEQEITALLISGTRRRISNFSIVFGITNATAAVGIQFGSNDIGTAADQFSCNLVENIFVRQAYRAYTCNSAGTTGTVWNNTFINCRADFPRSWAWFFNAIVGSTTQTWINCMVDGIATAGDLSFARPAGWYTHNIDDVSWTAGQADEMYDGACIYVNLASVVHINGFRTEGSYLRTTNVALIYMNARSCVVDGVKVQVLNCASAASTANVSVVRLSSSANAEVGDIVMEQCTLGEANFYKVDSNSTDFSFGSCNVKGTSTLKGEVRSEDSGMRTFYARDVGRVAPTATYPTSGTFERGNTLKTAGTSTSYGKVCTAPGSIGTAPTALVDTTAGSKIVTIASGSGVTTGTFITISGVAGVKLVKHLASGVFYIDSAADVTVVGASVSLAAPAFSSLGASDSSFTSMTLQNSWTVAGGRRAAYRKLIDNVQIELQTTGGTATNGTLIATLPSGFRPAFNQSLPCVSGPNAVLSASQPVPYLIFAADGTITCFNCSSASGIYFSGLISLV